MRKTSVCKDNQFLLKNKEDSYSNKDELLYENSMAKLMYTKITLSNTKVDMGFLQIIIQTGGKCNTTTA
jgi:hypothetical protein